MTEMAFQEFMPDQGYYNNPGITVAKNVLPYEDSYKSFPSQTVYSNALNARCQGAQAGRDNAGNTYNFAGNASKLYKLSGGTYSDVSKVGGYTTGAEESWFFTQFGSNMIATNYADAIQAFNMGTSSVFADLSATAPKARYIAVVRDFLVAGNVNDSTDGVVPHRLRWGPIGNPAGVWTPSAALQADYQDLDSAGGWIKQIVGGEYGVILQERYITKMTYIGSPDIFRFDVVEYDRGTPAPGSVTKYGNFIPYLGGDGFYIFDGQQSASIGAGKVDKFFYNDVDQNYMGRICSTIDPINKIIFWAYPGSDNTGGNPNKILAFNYSPSAKKRWAYAEQDLEFIYRSLAEGYTLDGLDAVSTSIDALLFSLDSRVWTGNSAILSGFNTSHKQVNFTGAALDATIETTEARFNPAGRSFITRLRPVIEGYSTMTVQLGTREDLNDTVTYGSAVSPETTTAAISVRSNARYHRARVNLSGGFDHAKGIDVEAMTMVGNR